MKIQGGDGAYADEMGCQCGNPVREHDGNCLPGVDTNAVLMALYRATVRKWVGKR